MHAALDRALRERAYFRDLPSYRDYLLRSLDFQSGAEHALDAAGIERLVPDWPLRRRAELIRADLREVGTGGPRAEAAHVTPREHGVRLMLATQPDAAHALGIAYVLEGSTLGARVLLREVAPLGVTADRGARFLGAGDRDESRWRSFVKLLDGARDLDVHAALAGARAAFSAARGCLA